MTARARTVEIDPEGLHHLATELRPVVAGLVTRSDPAPTDDPPSAAARTEAAARRAVVANAINFGSGFHDVVDKEPGLSGARTMALRLDRALDALVGGDPTAATGRRTPDPGDPAATGPALDWLRSFDPGRAAAVFGQSLDHPEQAELMDWFAQGLQDLGHLVAKRYGGTFSGLVEAADGSAQTLASALLALPQYRDTATHDGGRVHFLKRAQITAADVARLLPGWPPARFRDLDQLTAFADNLVPHVLRLDGVLRVDEELVARIDRRELLEPGGSAEVELRAAGVTAVERLVGELRSEDLPVRAMDLDLVLWERGAGARYKARPRARSRCPFY